MNALPPISTLRFTPLDAGYAAPGAARRATARVVQPTVAPARPRAAALVAGVVPGRVDYSGPVAVPSAPASLAMYSHPADLNAAATGVQAGRLVDAIG